MERLWHQLKRTGFDGFFFLLILTVLLSWLFPFYGTAESPLPLAFVTKYGVSLIFFFYGLRLNVEQLSTGLRNWKLHLLIQSTTFLVFPCFVLLFSFLLNSPGYRLWWIGAFYLAALPSTVSSSVVMVSIAGGNLPAAIFNASVSSIIGIFITPLWMGLFIGEVGGSAGFTDVVVKLCLQIIAPVMLGLLLHGHWGHFADKHKKTLRYFDQFIILLIIYTAFCDSFYNHMFSGYAPAGVVLLGAVMLALFFCMFGLMGLFSSFLKFTREDRITVLFCGSKKSLVQGAVMGRVLFSDPAMLGIILLPLMLYHALQLLAGSAIARKMAARAS